MKRERERGRPLVVAPPSTVPLQSCCSVGGGGLGDEMIHGVIDGEVEWENRMHSIRGEHEDSGVFFLLRHKASLSLSHTHTHTPFLTHTMHLPSRP